jgi:hypothetical protein
MRDARQGGGKGSVEAEEIGAVEAPGGQAAEEDKCQIRTLK